MNELKELKIKETSELVKVSKDVPKLSEKELNAPIEELKDNVKDQEVQTDTDLDQVSSKKSNVSFRGFIDDREYHKHKIKECEEWAQYYLRKSQEYAKNGDMYNSDAMMKLHKDYLAKAKEHQISMSKCTK